MRLRVVAVMTTAFALLFLTFALAFTAARVNRLESKVESLQHEVNGLWLAADVEPARNDRDE